MTQGLVTYPGILKPKGCTFTMNRGVSPDRIQVRMAPQTQQIPETGTLTLSYGPSQQLRLNNCLADSATIWMNAGGSTGEIVFLDRRWRWERYVPVSYHFNERDANGDLITATRIGLRDIFVLLLNAVGETNLDVSQVSNTFYPEVDEQCVRPVDLLDSLAEQYGYAVCPTFDPDGVLISRNGVGPALPGGTGLMSFSESLDPPTPPQFVRVCFGPSQAQVRLRCRAVGLETDGSIVPINSLSYTPAVGWDKIDINRMEQIRNQFNDQTWELALSTVYRWYAVDTYADGTLNHPDGSGSLSSINQILPLLAERLVVTDSGGHKAHPTFRVFGSYSQKWSNGYQTQDVFYEIHETHTLDRNQGIVSFNKPLVIANGAAGTVAPADVYLECAVQLRDATTNQYAQYSVDVPFDPSGAGYHVISEPTQHARTVITYVGNHAVLGVLTNQATIDAWALQLAAEAAGNYTYSQRIMHWYKNPRFDIRLNGKTAQVRHVITDGTDGEPGHYTIASQNMAFDKFVRTEADRRRDWFAGRERISHLPDLVLRRRQSKGNT